MERLALGPSGYLLNQSGAYDKFGSADELAGGRQSATPSASASTCRTRSGRPTVCRYTMHQHLVKTLGEPYASRLASAERLVSEFRSRRVAAEIVAFGEAAGIAIQLAERALSNEVITPGRTTLEDVGVVAAGPAARPRSRVGVRHAVGVRDRARGHRRDVHRPHRAARRRHHDRLGCAADELRHRREARRLRAEARGD